VRTFVIRPIDGRAYQRGDDLSLCLLPLTEILILRKRLLNCTRRARRQCFSTVSWTTHACRSIGMSSGAVSDLHQLSESRASRPSIGHLSFCVSLSQRESDCQARDYRTTKLRERDGSAASAAKAAGIRLCMKTVVGRPVRSAGISETIRTPGKAEITVMSDT
jgi:hypothetical protein